MSYDVYLWHEARGDIDELLDALAEEDVSGFVPHKSVGAFRRELLKRLPQLGDVIEPSADPGTDVELRYVALTLPWGWVELLSQVVELAAAHGLNGWDPQQDAPLRNHQAGRPEPTAAAVSGGDVHGPWTVKELSGLGVGAKSIARAWAAAGLPERASFGQAVGAFILAMAMRDGVKVSDEEAGRAVNEVAGHCAQGVPEGRFSVSIGYCTTDVPGFAEAVARGHF